MTFFLVIYLFLPFSTLLNFCLYVFLNTIHPSAALLYTPTCCFPRFYNSLSTLVTVNASECCIHHLFILKSSLHIFVHHCTFCASLHTKTSPANIHMETQRSFIGVVDTSNKNKNYLPVCVLCRVNRIK